MPYPDERSDGLGLIRLVESQSVRDFQGTVRVMPPEARRVPPTAVRLDRRNWTPDRVLAIDGSNIAEPIRNGFPRAEAGLVQLSVVAIDLHELSQLPSSAIPSPRVFHDMESAVTLDEVLPGANVVRRDRPNDTPRAYFRDTFYHLLHGAIVGGHESLLDTYRAITAGRDAPGIRCPVEGCDERYAPGVGAYACPCGRDTLFETDALRIHERFNEVGSNEEVHGEARHVLEVLALVNMLRYFASSDELVGFLRDCAFVLDGPLAMFGQPAWLTPFIRNELRRINEICRRKTGADIVVFGVEKDGAFVQHLHELDFDEDWGPRRRLEPGTAILHDNAYIRTHVVLGDPEGNAHVYNTYFGRKVLYKTRAGEHAVITTAMVDDPSSNLKRVGLDCHPRLSDILDVLDYLATYLYQDGFMPLVRAHAHAAIPLKRGGDIVRELFRDRQPGR